MLKSMKDLAIYGAGGLGKEVYLLLKEINSKTNEWNFIGFYDRMYDKGYSNGYGTVLGNLDDLNTVEKDLDLVIAMGDGNIRRLVVESIHNQRIHYPNVISQSVSWADLSRTNIGQGNIIVANSAFSCDISIGDFNLMNGQVIFGHDVKIGDFNSIMPKVFIAGCANVGNDNFFGVGSIILQNLTVGNNVHLGAGSVLMTKPKDGNTYLGNPAKLFKY